MENSIKRLIVEDPHSGVKNEIHVKHEEHGISIGAPGYGVKNMDGNFPPIYVEIHKGVLQVYVWGDIEDEEPTEVISLNGAQRK